MQTDSTYDYKNCELLLKRIVDSPSAFLSKYFNDLRNEVNVLFALKSNKEGAIGACGHGSDKKQHVNRVWLEMASRIDSLEKECLKNMNLKKAELLNETVVGALALARSSGYLECQESLEKIRKIIFVNKTIVFLKYYSDFLNTEAQSKLVIIKDACLTEEGISYLKGKYETIQNETDEEEEEDEDEDEQEGNEETETQNNDEEQEEEATETNEDVYEEDTSFADGSELSLDDDMEDMAIRDDEDVEVDQNKNPITGKLTIEKLKLRELRRKLVITSHVAEVSLASLTNYKSMKLQFNEIESIDADSFINLTNLVTLWLHFNRINSIGSNTFSQLIGLVNLKLNNNELESLSPNLFQCLSNLKTLHLEHNKLSSLDSNTFAGLVQLKELWLNDNQLNSIDPTCFNELIRLETLLLNNNKLKYIHQATFSQLKQLQSLHLAYNQLESFEDRTFQSLTSLQTLELNNNQIKTINSNLFKELNNLQALFLNANKLERVDEVATFETMKKLTRLDTRPYRLENFKFNFIMQKNEKKRTCHFENENNKNE